ncbi:tetrahydromethanopterin S-methyltransferase subunit H [Candidatus Thorarchaeota archaeon]|nr:MAG: tetrahydromethanopterin S-methyltransferase subunit H [Candidatus Thorarchaeota archaeon]
MFVFEKEQVIHRIGDVEIGGSPGELPTVLVGTIFYQGDKLVDDAKKGRFDREAAEDQINAQQEMSDITGNPCMLQVCSESEVAIREFIDFVSDVSDVPFLIDSTESHVRTAGLRYAEETGLLDRAVYNSISVSLGAEEIEELSMVQPESAIILAFNPHDSSVAGRRAVLETGIDGDTRGLLALAEEVGIRHPLIDTATTALGAGAGSAVAFTFVSKSVYGLPTGSGIHNAPASWTWLQKRKKEDREAYMICDAASSILVQLMGADFVLYGPLKSAKRVFPVASMADILTAESMKTELGIEPSDEHPFKKLL